MSFSNIAELAINNYIFKGTDVSWDANADLYWALYTSDPGEAGTATSNEIAYTNYARVSVDRATGLTLSVGTVTNTGLIQFPICGASSGSAVYVGICDTATGAGTLILSGALAASQTIQNGNQPQFNAGDFVFTLD